MYLLLIAKYIHLLRAVCAMEDFVRRVIFSANVRRTNALIQEAFWWRICSGCHPF
jgi:hypothetical protein